MSVGVDVVLGVAVLALLIYRQLRSRPVSASGLRQAWSKGSWLTAVLWIVALAAHLGYDALVTPGRGSSGLGAATVVLYLAVSLGIQRVITQQRANRLEPGGATTFSEPGQFS